MSTFFLKIKKLLNYFLPPLFFNFIRQYYIYRQQKKLGYDPRRFWQGKKVTRYNSNSGEFDEFFDNFSGELFIINLKNEVKSCVIIKPYQKKIFTFKKKFINESEILLQFGNIEEKINGSYSAYSKNKIIADIISPSANEWNRIWIDKKDIFFQIEIFNNSKQDMYFAVPVLIYPKSQTNKINNFIFLILDQVDQKIFKTLEQNNSLKNISKFFKNGITYNSFYSAGDWTVPAFTSLFTGQQSSHHSFNDLKYTHDLKNTTSIENIFTLASKNNFDTFCICKSKGHNPLFGFQKFVNRFFFFDYIPNKADDDDDLFIGKLIDHFEANKDTKIFSFIHFNKSHSPYYQPSFMEQKKLKNFRIGDSFEEFKNAEIGIGDTKIETYLDEKLFENIRDRQAVRLQRLDIILDQLFSYLERNDLMKETVVILTSDHGIPHGLKNKPILNNEWVNIPLKIYHPLFNPSEVNSPASTANIYDLIKAIIEDNYKDIGVIRPFNLNSKIDFSISESFFNKKYKALIKDSRYEFRIVTTFDPIKKFIFLNNIIYSEITENNNIINDKDVYNYFFRILVDNINKSKIIKIIN
jgi:hypothetical protein